MKSSDVLFFVKYPYASVVIATVWIGSALMVANSPSLDVIFVVVVNMVFTWIVAWFGFR